MEATEYLYVTICKPRFFWSSWKTSDVIEKAQRERGFTSDEINRGFLTLIEEKRIVVEGDRVKPSGLQPLW